MANAVLQLVVEKGPRRGEVLNCTPGSAPISIGRVVSGNTFAIKDPGISQKHLLLQFLSPASGWAVTDLDTSNGTLLNGLPLPPSRPVPVSAGDTIKIGERTSIKLNIVAADADPKAENGRPRRTRASSRKGEAAEPVMEERRGRGRRAGTRANQATASVTEEILEPIAEDGDEISTRAKGRIGIPEGAGIFEPDGAKNLRRGRRSGRGRGRRGGAGARSARVPKEKQEDEVGSEVAEVTNRGELGGKSHFGEEESVVVGSRDGVEIGGDENLRRGRRSGRGRGRRGGAGARSARVPKEKQEDEVGSEVAEVANRGELGGKSHFGEEESVVVGSRDGVEIGGDENDMEKMTLGEWFDQMEKYLPQVINDVSEEIIASLREKARKLNEFIENGSTTAG